MASGLEIVPFFINYNTIIVCVSIETELSQAQFNCFVQILHTFSLDSES